MRKITFNFSTEQKLIEKAREVYGYGNISRRLTELLRIDIQAYELRQQRAPAPPNPEQLKDEPLACAKCGKSFPASELVCSRDDAMMYCRPCYLKQQNERVIDVASDLRWKWLK